MSGDERRDALLGRSGNDLAERFLARDNAMLEIIEARDAEIERLRAEVERIEGQRKLRADLAYLFKAERDDERRLADQLAAALFAVKHDRPSVHSDRVWATLQDALEAHDEARRG